MKKKKIILASASPRRKELLEQVGLEYEIMPADVDESVVLTNPKEVVEELAEKKASSVAQKVEEGIVLGADTVVVLDGEILGKPKSEEEAFRMMTAMQGRKHAVYTGVSMIVKEDRKEKARHTFSVKTNVFMYPLEEEEIRRYVQTKEPYDKAGGYGIQGRAAAFIEKIDGDYNNVVGLPISKVCRELKKYL